MNRIRAAALLLVLALGTASGIAPVLAQEAREDTVLILHTNDLHGHIENAATLSGLAKAERAKRKDVIWLDAGDAITGTPVSTVYKGGPIFGIMTAMGVDAACLGNHEFDYGWAHISSFRSAADFPLLAANARDPQGNLLADDEWRVFNVDGVRVGVIGLVTENTPASTVKKGNEGVRFEPAKDALQRLVPVVRKECDLLVALTHLGYEADVELARSVKGVDVIVGGHTHTDLPGPVKVGGTLVVQAFRYGERLGRLEVTVDLDQKRITKWEGKPIVVDREKQPRDENTAYMVERFEASIENHVKEVVAEAREDLDKAALNALAESVFRDALKADFGLNNVRGVRDVLKKGPVTVRQLWTIFPFDNTLVRVKVRGDRLPQELADRARRAAGGADPVPDRLYTVAVNSYMADHLDSYVPGAEPGPEDTGIVMRRAIVDWVREHKTLP